MSTLSSKSEKNFLRPWIGIGLAILLAGGTFLSGVTFGNSMQRTDQSASLFSFLVPEPTIAVAEESAQRPSLESFWEVWDLLEEKYATGSSTDEMGIEQRIEGAIDGLVSAYEDPYTIYLPPSDAESFAQNISGNFSGVGMEIGIRENLLTVIAPLPDTPAERAGILAGDIIVKIDKTSTEDMRVDQAVDLIRGEKGTEVILQIYREGEDEFLTIPVVRDTINVPTVKSESVDDVFIITLYSFNAVAEEQFRNALYEYLENDYRKLIVDVRGNPGGFLQGAVNISSYFLPAGKVVVKEQFGDESRNEIMRSRNGQIQTFTPKNLVILVDNGSASASEILAGALKDHEVATVIGTQTFGKGSVQELVELEDGSALKVTIARWLTPNGTSISNGGLAPHIVIKRTPQQRIAGEDPQREAALRFLAGEEVVSETFEDQLAGGESSGE